jgi:CAAX protease family protein
VKRTAVVDVCVVAGVSISYVVLEALSVPKRWTFLLAAIVLAAYVVYLVRKRPHSWRDLGFRTDNLRAALVPVGAFTAVAALGLVVWAVVRGVPLWNSQVPVLLAVYPAWALVQQLAFQGLLHRGLAVLVRPPALAVLVTAASFAAVHAGNALLVALTFAAGVAWSSIWRRRPNLWLLAASHTILAALAYPLVLGDAPLWRV